MLAFSLKFHFNLFILFIFITIGMCSYEPTLYDILAAMAKMRICSSKLFLLQLENT